MGDMENVTPDDIIGDIMGHVTYTTARFDEYMLGPLSGIKKTEDPKMELPARLAGDEIEFNPEKLAKMGLAPINGDTPTVAAWVGFRIPRNDRGDRLWADIKNGQRTQLSIVGTGSREVLL